MTIPPLEIEITADPKQGEVGLGKLARSINALDNATAEYQETLSRVNRAEKAGLLTKQQATAAIKKAEQQYESAAQAAAQYAGATARVSQATRRMGVSASQAAQGMRYLPYQLNQIAQSGAVTGQWMVAVNQQIPDILAGFGSMPLVIAGGAAAMAGAFLPALLSANSEIGNSEDRLDQFVSALNSAASAAQIAGTPIGELRDEFGQFADEVQRASQVVAQAALSDAMTGLETVSTDIQQGLADATGAAEKYQHALDNLAIVQQTLGEKTISNAAAFDDAEKYVEAARLKANEAAQAIGLTSLQAVQLNSALSDLASAEGMDAVAAAASRSLDLIGGMFDESQNIPPEVAKIVAALERVLSSAASGAKAFDDMADGANNTARAATSVYAEFQKSREEAAKLSAKVMEAYRAGEDLSNVDVGAGVDAASIAAAELAKKLGVSLAIALKMARMGNALAAPGGPDQARAAVQDIYAGSSGLRREDIVSQFTLPARTAPSGGGAVGAAPVPAIVQDIEALQNSLMTETEIIQSTYAERQELLATALEQNYITQSEYHDLMQSAEFEHANRMAQIKQQEADMVSSAAKGMYSELAGFLGTFAGKSAAAAKAQIAINTALRVAEIRQNTAAAQLRALAELGPVAGAAAASKIAAFGAVQAGLAAAAGVVNFSQAGASGGGSSSGGGGASAVATAGRADTLDATIRIESAGGLSSEATQEIASIVVEQFRDRGLTSAQVFG